MTDWYTAQMDDDAMLGPAVAESKWHARQRVQLAEHAALRELNASFTEIANAAAKASAEAYVKQQNEELDAMEAAD